MSAMASQITSLTIVYSTVYSRRRTKETSKFRFTGLCVRNSLVASEFLTQRASNAEKVCIWWRHRTSSHWRDQEGYRNGIDRAIYHCYHDFFIPRFWPRYGPYLREKGDKWKLWSRLNVQFSSSASEKQSTVCSVRNVSGGQWFLL